MRTKIFGKLSFCASLIGSFVYFYGQDWACMVDPRGRGGRADPKHLNSLRLEKDTIEKNLPVDPRQGSRNSYRESNSWIS
jgi:hypothetical protein